MLPAHSHSSDDVDVPTVSAWLPGAARSTTNGLIGALIAAVFVAAGFVDPSIALAAPSAPETLAYVDAEPDVARMMGEPSGQARSLREAESSAAAGGGATTPNAPADGTMALSAIADATADALDGSVTALADDSDVAATGDGSVAGAGAGAPPTTVGPAAPPARFPVAPASTVPPSRRSPTTTTVLPTTSAPSAARLPSAVGPNVPTTAAPAATSGAPAGTSTPDTTTPPSRVQPTTTTRAATTTRVPSTTRAAVTTVAPTTTVVPVTAAPTTTSRTTTSASGRTIHVRAGGSGNGSASSNALGSIAAGVDRAQPGDTVLVHGGTYPGFRVDKSGRDDAWIVVAAAPGTTPLIDPPRHAGVTLDGVHHIEIRGFEIKGHQNSSGAGVRIANSAYSIKVIGNHVYDFPGNGIEVYEAGGVEIRGNRVHGNSRRSPYQTSGISIFKARGADNPGWDNVIADNIVFDNINIVRSAANKITDGNCIIIDYTKQYGYRGGFLIENNLCADNGGRGIHVFHSNNVLARNNTLFRNLTHAEIRDGELTALEANNVEFRNNLVWSTDGAKDVHLWRANDTRVVNNIIVGEKIDNSGGNNPTVSNPALRNPNLRPSADDFRPSSSSPVVGRSTGSTPSRDLRGTARPGSPTVGALEP